MAALGTFVAGRYSSTYTAPGGAAADMGFVEKGYTITVTHAKDIIKDTDAYADIEIDSVHRGMNVYLGLKCKEYKAAPLAAAFMYNAAAFAPTGANTFGPGTIGRLGSAVAGAINLSATAGTPAASSPAALVVSFADIMEGFNIDILFGPEHRMLPLRFRMLLYLATGVPAFFTTT